MRSSADSRGLAVYLVVGLALILFGLGALLSMRSTFNISAQRRIRQSLEARYLAEAGLQRTLHYLKHGQTRLSDRFDFGGGKVALQFQPGTGPFGERVTDVLSQGTYQELQTSLFAKVEVDPAFLKSATASSDATDSATTSSESTTPPASPGSAHVALVKYVVTLPEDASAVPDLPSAQKRFDLRMKSANTRYVEGLASVGRAELRWNLYRLGCAVADADASAAAATTTTP
ncbi:MAG: hypothetical protein HY303_14755 [Candidatus Wallbacteria bacterium]|nr:hypothetical protein [Candidatus Wallbacteria bacterium]